MLENEKVLNELEDEDLNQVAGGGTYNKEGYLRTIGSYNCDYFERVVGVEEPCCWSCRWHKTMLCTNPKNKRS